MKAIIKWIKARKMEWDEALYYYNMSRGMYLWNETHAHGWEQSSKEGRESQIQPLMCPPNLFNIAWEAWGYPLYLRLIEKTICRWKGHKLVDESYGGPDSGNVDVHCKRCLKNWYEQLY